MSFLKGWVVAVFLAAALAWPQAAEARRHRARAHTDQKAETVQVLHGEVRLMPELGDQDIDVCLAGAVEDVRLDYAEFAQACAVRGGTASLTPAELGTNLVTFNEVTLLCTLDATATCAGAEVPGGACR